MRKWMENKWCRDKEIDDLDRTKRRVYGLYLTINYYTGARCKEMLGLRWKDIQPIPTESKEDQRINRSTLFLLKMLKLDAADISLHLLPFSLNE